jgi:uncharacterized protein
MSNRVVHFEIPCNDPQKTMDFFASVFGWSFQQFGDVPYWSVITGPEGTPGINGGIMLKKDPMQPVANSILVDNIDEHILKVGQAGGLIVVPKMAIPGVGWLAYFKDPDGNIHGLYQHDPTATM